MVSPNHQVHVIRERLLRDTEAWIEMIKYVRNETHVDTLDPQVKVIKP